MKITDTIRTLLRSTGKNRIFSVTPDQSVYEAIEKMAAEGIGAVLVISGNKLVGILSERDYARKVILKGHSSKDTPVSDIMTTPGGLRDPGKLGGRVHGDHDESPFSASSGGGERCSGGGGVDWRPGPLDDLGPGAGDPGAGGVHYRAISGLKVSTLPFFSSLSCCKPQIFVGFQSFSGVQCTRRARCGVVG